MNNYVIYTDSASDIGAAELAEWGVKCAHLTFKFDGDDTIYAGDDMDSAAFYERMRAGGVAKTAAVNMDSFTTLFEAELREGRDVIYIGFSSAMSTTFQAARLAASDLREQYPDRQIHVVDSLSGSVGQALLAYLVAEQRRAGVTVAEAAAFAEGIKGRLGVWLTVDDLVYLKRGGRISPAVAFLGNALGLKPIIYVSGEGKLETHSKARGRKNAMATLSGRYAEGKGGRFMISHADCADAAEQLAAAIKEAHSAEVVAILNIGPVIGAHLGPGGLVLGFLGEDAE